MLVSKSKYVKILTSLPDLSPRFFISPLNSRKYGFQPAPFHISKKCSGPARCIGRISATSVPSAASCWCDGSAPPTRRPVAPVEPGTKRSSGPWGPAAASSWMPPAAGLDGAGWGDLLINWEQVQTTSQISPWPWYQRHSKTRFPDLFPMESVVVFENQAFLISSPFIFWTGFPGLWAIHHPVMRVKLPRWTLGTGYLCTQFYENNHRFEPFKLHPHINTVAQVCYNHKSGIYGNITSIYLHNLKFSPGVLLSLFSQAKRWGFRASTGLGCTSPTSPVVWIEHLWCPWHCESKPWASTWCDSHGIPTRCDPTQWQLGWESINK